MELLNIAIRSFADFEAVLSAQLAAYRELTGAANAKIVSCDLRSLEESVLGSPGLRSGEWDLAIFPTDWIGAAITSESLEDLDPWMRENPLTEWPEDWPSSLLEPIQRQGKYYCIPWHDGPECLIYRKDLFESEREQRAFSKQFCRPLTPPATWHEFREVAGFFNRPAQGLYGTVFAAYPDGHNTLYDLVLQVWSRGGELYDAEGRPALESDEAIEALEYYRTFIRDSSVCYPGAAQIDSVQSGEVFRSGQIAMMVNWFGFAARCESGSELLRGKLGMAPIPGGHSGQTASLSNYWVIGIGSGSRQKQESYKLLRHIASAPMDKLTSLHGAVGVRLSTWNDPQVLERVPLYGELERLSAQARTLPFCQDLPKLAEIVNKITIESLSTDESSRSILSRAQATATARGLRLRHL